MANSDYISDLKSGLHKVDQAIENATARLSGGKLDERSAALSDLTHLRQRHKDLVKRIEDAEKKGAKDWSALHMSFQEEADALIDTLNDWLTRDD